MDYKVLIKKAKALGFDDIEISLKDTTSATITIYNGQIDKNEISSIKSFAIKAMYKGKLGYYNFENASEDEDKILAKLLDNASSINTEEEVFIYEGDKEYPKVRKASDDFLRVKGTDKIEMLQKIEKEIRDADSRVVFIPHLGYEESKTNIELINSKGLNLHRENSVATLFTQVVVKDGNETQSAFEIQSKRSYAELDAGKIASNAVKKAVELLNAKTIASDKYPVIIENKAMSSMLAAFSSLFSGEAALRKLTALIGKENQKIMSDKITIIDDPLCETALINHPFDDDGVACYKKFVVKNGIFQTFLHNLKTAKYFNTKSTGNAVGSSAGTLNLYIACGTKTKEELIKETERGILITNFAGLHAGVNAISGEFNLQSSGFLIENGEKVKPVTLIVTSGNFLKAMSEVDEVACDLETDFNRFGSPSIKFTALQISGE